MRFNKLLLIPKCVMVFFICSISCTERKNSEESKSWGKSLELKDSIMLDYMEKLILMDATKGFDEFLALNPKTDEILLFNIDGTVISSFKNERDSPKSVNDIFSVSFIERGILVGGRPLKLTIFDREGNQNNEVKIPSLTPRTSAVLQKQIFSTNDNRILGHLNAYPDSAFTNGLMKPMLVLIDPENELASKPLLKIPSQSKYSSGQFHGYVFPILWYSENKLFLAYSNEPIIYVFTYNNDELTLDKAIDLNISEFIQIIPSPTEDSYNFDKNHREMKPGMIWKIFTDDNQIYIMYAKGTPEDTFESAIHDKGNQFALESNPYYLMVLDKDYRVLQKDIAIPYYISGGFSSVSNDGVFIGRKNPIFSEIEADHEIFYTYKLVETK